jgi:hypothetical protein
MSGTLFVILPFVIPLAWKTSAQSVWCVFTFGGMSVWIWHNRDRFKADDRTPQAKPPRATHGLPSDVGRTIPLTDVQARFLAVMDPEQDSEV